MNCQELWSGWPDSTGPVSAGEREHLANCPACAARWRGREGIREGLRALAAEDRHVQAPERLEARLVSAFRAQAWLGRQHRPNPWTSVLAWGAAAVVLVGLALFLVRDRQPQPVHRNASAVQMAAVGWPGDVNADAATEADGGFIPLLDGEGVSMEEADLVRVEVPRSTMMALGYTVSADRAGEPVEAEVILGADGLARAVRFLDE